MSEPVDLTKPVRLKSTKHRVYFPAGIAPWPTPPQEKADTTELDGRLQEKQR